MAKRGSALADDNKNYFVFTLLLIAVIGVSWGAYTKVEAGVLYLSIFLSTIGILVLAQFFTAEKDKKTLNQFFKTPFVGSPRVALAMYYIGFFAIIFINLIGGIFKQGFSTVQFFSPLYLSAGGLGQGFSQTFSASVVENSPFASWFYGVFVAGTIEEFTWAFTLPLAFWIVAMFINQIAFDNKLGKNFYFWLAMAGSILTFGGIHKLNASYVGIMFVIAMIFRFMMNTSIYKVGMAVSFSMGMHQSNNNVAWVLQNGLGKLIEILFTNWYGLIIVALFIGGLVAIFVPRKSGNIDKLITDFKAELRGFEE